MFFCMPIVHWPRVSCINDTNGIEYFTKFLVQFASTETFTGELLAENNWKNVVRNSAGIGHQGSNHSIPPIPSFCHREQLILNYRVQEVRKHLVVASPCTINTQLIPSSVDVHRSPSLICGRAVCRVCLAFPHCKFYGNA